MEKNKNILIAGLLAIVLIMAVGYAAFATQLQINGTANISSTWDVHFIEDNTKKTITSGGGVEPEATMELKSSTVYTVSAKLKQPGDKIVYTFTVENSGTLPAKISDLTLSSKGNEVIKFSIEQPASTDLLANGGTSTFTLTAEYVSTNVTVTDALKTASTSISFTANQK